MLHLLWIPIQLQIEPRAVKHKLKANQGLMAGGRVFLMLRRLARRLTYSSLSLFPAALPPCWLSITVALRRGVGEIVSRPHGKRTL